MTWSKPTIAAVALLCAMALYVLGSGTLAGNDREDSTVIVVPSAGGALVLAVRTGTLPAGAELVLETQDGQRIGSVTTFGATANAAPDQIHLVVADLDGLPGDSIAIQARLVHEGVDRPATSREFLGVEVAGQ